MNMNKVILTGNLVKDTDFVTLPSGTKKCTFRIAVNGYNEHTDYFGIVVFGNISETCHKYLKKGSRVAVMGRISTREFTGNDGQKRTIYEIVADEVEFLGRLNTDGGEEEKTDKAPSYQQDKMGGLPPVDDEDLPW